MQAAASDQTVMMTKLVEIVKNTPAGGLEHFENFGLEVLFTEFKAGKPVILATNVQAEAMKEIATMNYYGKQKGWLRKHMKANKRTNAHACIMEKSALKHTGQILENKMGVGSALLD
jgi:hypothetical protein